MCSGQGGLRHGQEEEGKLILVAMTCSLSLAAQQS